MFSVHTSPEDFKNAPITDYFGFKLGQENHVVIVTSLFSKSSVFKIFLSTCTRKRKDGVFKFLRFNLESVFVIRFRDGLLRTEGLTVEIKLRFLISPANFR